MSFYANYIERRQQLLKILQETYPGQKGLILIAAGFEQSRYSFRQDSTFYYLTGIEEPAAALTLSEEGSTVWVPQYSSSRAQWVSQVIDSAMFAREKVGIDTVKTLGQTVAGYTLKPYTLEKEYEQLLQALSEAVKKGLKLYTLNAPEQKRFIQWLCLLRPELAAALVDISSIVAGMRRTKSRDELELIYDAVDCTMQAQEAAAVRVAPGTYEYQLQAAVEFVFKESGASPAFPTIVASGKNSTTLHYTANRKELRSGELVVIDCGAEVGYYAADITRTYPVSGSFTSRQREVYDIVLEVQQYISEQAVPGVWLNNTEQTDKSLHHMAGAFLNERGYGQYFTHAIGHFLGLDVHDVGAEHGPLKEGDVITIEPGIYIKEEGLGIRIEDTYWITEDSAVCMSEELPRDSYEIEELMKASFDEDDEY